MFFPNSEPDQIKAVGQLDATTGVDLQVGMTMSFPPTSNVQPAMDESNVDESTPKLPGAGVAVLSFGVLCESVEETTMIGTKGRMTLQSPGHCPTRLTVDVKADGRGAKAESNVYEYALPEDTEEIKKAGGYFYPNSAGFAYEAAGVARCIAAGKLEAPQFTLDETMLNLKLMDEARRQIGVASVDAVNGFH
uniref:Gfo/Idh/MocA-like oxidoreductase C-terminal domain-containing protein n=1 Tax=Craspedostauros australis TaxID=1486917 RepID=A0A7R9ZKN0_9STRA